MADDKRKSLYDKISTKYDLGSFDEFSAKLDQPGKIKSLYDKLSNDFDLGDYAEFEGKLKKKEPTVSESPSPDGTSSSENHNEFAPIRKKEGDKFNSNVPDYQKYARHFDPLEYGGTKTNVANSMGERARGYSDSGLWPTASSAPLPQDAVGASLSGTDMAQTVPPQSPQTAPAKTQESGLKLPEVPKRKEQPYGGIALPEMKVDILNLPDKNKKEAAFKNAEAGNYDVASQIIKTVNDDTDGYVYELQAYIDERNGNVKQSQQNLKQAVNLAPNNLRLYPQLATISYKAGDIATATQAADKYIAEAGVAGGDKEKAEGLATSYAIKGDKEKSDYWHKTKLQIEEFERQQGLANTLKSMPDYLIHESIPGRLATGGFSTIGLGVDNIVNAIRGEETVNGETKPLTSFERLVTGFIEIGRAHV